jgi:hypothetical protein
MASDTLIGNLLLLPLAIESLIDLGLLDDLSPDIPIT